MANPRHLDILRQGVDVWNRWREENPELLPDLSNSNLSWAYLRAANLSGADLSQAKLRGANLREADFFIAELRAANLSGADLRAASLSETDLNGALLDRANLAQVTGLTQDQINEACGDQDTELPEGLQRPAHWLEELERKPLFLRAVSFMASLFSRRGSGRASVG